MKKEKSPGAMKKFIKKMAITVLTGAIAFSVVPQQCRQQDGNKTRTDTGGRKMITVIRKISGKPFMENSTILIQRDIWILTGRR